jgi:hypothetical protein
MVWPLLVAGAGLAAAGSTAQLVGARQASKAQNRVFDEEQDAQNEEDRRAQELLAQFLDENDPDQRREDTVDREREETTALNQVADSITGGAQLSAAGGAEGAQGKIATMGQGVRAGAARRTAPVARVKAYQDQALADDERLRDYMLGRNRIALRATGRSRLLPGRLNTAGLKGSETRAVGAGASALGQLLLMYGISPTPTPGTPV